MTPDFNYNITATKPVFDEVPHTYKSVLGFYLSNTTYLHTLEPAKDWDAIAQAYANKHGNTKEYWLATWKEAGKIGCEKGTKEHKKREDIILTRETKEGLRTGYYIRKGVTYTNPNIKVIDVLDLLTLPDGVYAEVLVWNNVLMLSGTADVVILGTDEQGRRTIFIDDFKTNKEIKKYNFKTASGQEIINSWLNLPAGYSAMCDCNHSIYQLQINVYGWMFTQFGFVFLGGNLIHTEAKDKLYPIKNYQPLIGALMLDLYKSAHKRRALFPGEFVNESGELTVAKPSTPLVANFRQKTDIVDRKRLLPLFIDLGFERQADREVFGYKCATFAQPAFTDSNQLIEVYMTAVSLGRYRITANFLGEVLTAQEPFNESELIKAVLNLCREVSIKSLSASSAIKDNLNVRFVDTLQA